MIMMMSFLAGCGQNLAIEEAGESFAAVNEVVEPQTVINPEAEADPPKETALTASPSSAPAVAAEEKDVLPTTSVPEAGTVESPEVHPPVESTPATTAPAVPPVKRATTSTARPSKSSDKAATAAPDVQTVNAAATAKPKATQAPVTSATSTSKPHTQGVSEIGWLDFFDGEDQTRPSERFWDLHGSQVTIKGFMGEVLSFEKNWFLLIPEPGAECPFDNGDETYWNKIMIVFVPDDVKLRYKSGPLQITGRLDVGIKIDESGYKTMFRLYDASFKEI
jgi:hypothetical protein